MFKDKTKHNHMNVPVMEDEVIIAIYKQKRFFKAIGQEKVKKRVLTTLRTCLLAFNSPFSRTATVQRQKKLKQMELKPLTLLCSKQPKLHRVLAVLSVIGLSKIFSVRQLMQAPVGGK